jgi:hypothetical protein
MRKRCPMCFSNSFRLSKLRRGDVLRLLLLMYPIRCLECHWRSFAFLPLAMKFKPTRKTVKPQSA